VGGAVSAYPTRSSHPTSEPLWARLALPALAIAGAAVALLDLAAILSSLACGHGFPRLKGGWVGGAVSLLVHGGDPQQIWATPRAAPPEWLLDLILVLLLGGAVAVSLFLSQRWRIRREETLLGDARRKRHGFLSPHQAAARFGERATRREASSRLA